MLNKTPQLKHNIIWPLNFTMLNRSILDSCSFLFCWRVYLWSSPGKMYLPFASNPITGTSLPVKGNRIACKGRKYCSLAVAGCIPCHLPAADKA